ncbi:hypothetical protein [Streptosporangium sp. NPDC087985]|uniref:hypothetical protein n=1 Tax=Streptosporangium sp. NPDC087985 TaxID=3366196 RepID=UPI003803A8D7
MIRRRPARPRGRHRSGLALSAVPSYTWDHGARAEAVRLEAAWPGWAVLYGTGSRLFYAIATWPTPEPLIVSDRTPEGLETLMNDAETATEGASVPGATRVGRNRHPGRPHHPPRSTR